jgi:hypothetical protein
MKSAHRVAERFKQAVANYRYIAKCRACSTVTSGESSGYNMQLKQDDPRRTGDIFQDQWGNQVIACRKCGALARVKLIRGKYNPGVVCNAKCLASTGSNCECSCAGKNHGSAFAS